MILCCCIAATIYYYAAAVGNAAPHGGVQMIQPEPVQFASNVCGRVARVGKDHVTIDVEGHSLRTFRIDGVTVKGEIRAPLESHSYRLDQLQIDDNIIVDYYHYDGVEAATLILIRRRPGGVVPEQPFTLPTDGLGAWHARMNACQDWEERGIHLPFKYEDPPPPDLSRPYFRRPQAPPPRVVGPRPIPPAAP